MKKRQISPNQALRTASASKRPTQKPQKHPERAGRSRRNLTLPLTYWTWVNIKSRCLNPGATNYRYYGGSGITVCDRWLLFENFFEDMGPKPSPDHWLKRIDTKDGYHPGNCYWQPPEEREKKPKRKVRLRL